MNSNCDVCVHHLDGDCSKWKCEFLVIDDNKKEIIDEVLHAAIHKLDNSRIYAHEDYVDGIDFSIGILENMLNDLKLLNLNLNLNN